MNRCALTTFSLLIVFFNKQEYWCLEFSLFLFLFFVPFFPLLSFFLVNFSISYSSLFTTTLLFLISFFNVKRKNEEQIYKSQTVFLLWQRDISRYINKSRGKYIWVKQRKSTIKCLRERLSWYNIWQSPPESFSVYISSFWWHSKDNKTAC